jgi:lysophospholipase L1-like esterase
MSAISAAGAAAGNAPPAGRAAPVTAAALRPAALPPGRPPSASEPRVLREPVTLPPCTAPHRSVSRHGSETRIISFGCPVLDKSPAKLPKRVARNRPAATGSAAVPSLTPAAICPATPSGTLVADRFEMCLNVAVTVPVVATYGLDSFEFPVTYQEEMWTVLEATSRSWTVEANFNVLPFKTGALPSPFAFDLTASITCTSPNCTASSTEDLGSVTPAGLNASLDAPFTDNGTATDALDDKLVYTATGENGWDGVNNSSMPSFADGNGGKNPIRCDSTISTAPYNAGGCVDPYLAPVWTVSNATYKTMGLAAKNMAMATGSLNPPYAPLQTSSGSIPGVSTPLKYVPSLDNANRAALCDRLTPPPAEVKAGNTSCDEYPFATTLQGAASGGPVSVCWVPKAANSSQGGAYIGFINQNRVLPNDQFYVDATYTPGGISPGCDDSGTFSGGNPRPTMMVVGDSISQGFEGDMTWRDALATIETDVPGFSFAGPWSGTDSLPASLPAGWPTTPAPPVYDGAYAPGEVFPDNGDSQHYARWGWQMTQAEPGIEATVAQYMPNYLLVELGFNDLAWGIQSPQGLLAEAKNVIAQARAANPSIRILFANVVQRSPLTNVPGLPATITSYDQGLPGTLASLSTAQSPVNLVDLAGQYSYGTDTYDGLHPNNIGEWVIADAFANALASDFGVGGGSSYLPGSASDVPVSTPPTPTLTPNAAGIDVSWPYEFGAEGYMLEVANLSWGQSLGPATELPLPVPADSWELTQLIPGDTYAVAIQAVRGYEQSGWSGGAQAVAEPSTPAPPASISVVSVSGGIDLSWTTPTGLNDAGITGYEIQWLDNSSTTASLHETQVTGNSYKITDGDGISPGDTIGVAISAVNSAGPGYPTGSSVIPDAGTPAAPTITSDQEVDANDDALTWTPGSSASTAGYWVTLDGYPTAGSVDALPYELPPSDTSFTAGYLNGLAGSVMTCVQAANGTVLSTLTLGGPDCATPPGPAAASIARLLHPSSGTAAPPRAIHAGPANAGIAYKYFTGRFRLMLEGAGGLSAAGIATASPVSTTGKLLPAISPDSVQAMLGKPADFVVVVPPRKYR